MSVKPKRLYHVSHTLALFQLLAFGALSAFALTAHAGDDDDAKDASGTPPVTAPASAPAAASTPAPAGEEEGAKDTQESEEKQQLRNRRLDDRIKSVQRKVFIKKGRLELFPYFGIDLNDALYQHMVVGASLGYHIVDSLEIEARGGAVVATRANNVVRFIRIDQGAVPHDPTDFKYHADLDATWAPIYGKISLLGDSILHFDTYISAGGGVFGTDLGANPSANVAIGQRYFITRWLTARLELRDYFFSESRDNVSNLQNLLVFGFSVSGFLPTSFEYDFQ